MSTAIVAVAMHTVVEIGKMHGEDEDDTSLLIALHQQAENYIRSFIWCLGIRESYFGVGIGGVIAAFLFRIAPKAPADEWLWVITGDIPPAYLVTDSAADPIEALQRYCEVMEEWVNAVRAGGSMDGVFPVAAPADEAHASTLAGRLAMLREDIIPQLSVGVAT